MPVNMLDYLSLFSGMTHLRSCHVDILFYVSSALPKGIDCIDFYFYRDHLLWNELPLKIIETRCQTTLGSLFMGSMGKK